MARTRTQRRRQTLRIVVALIVTFLILVFGREVSRSAHQAQSARRSENLSFATMAGTLLTQENAFDAQLATLLTNGSTLTRPSLALQLTDMTRDLSLWRTEAAFLKSPVLTPSLNLTLADATVTRVNDYATVLAYVADGLTLTGPNVANPSVALGAAQQSLLATAASWGGDRHALASSPGTVTLAALTNSSAGLNVRQDVATLASSSNLAATRAIVISALQVQPAPFPAPQLTLLLAPTSTMQVQIAVTNLREIVQPITLTMVLTSASGATQRVTSTRSLAPLSSYAFDPHAFSVVPGEKGTLSVTLNGIPASGSLLHSRTYSLSVSPSGTG